MQQSIGMKRKKIDTLKNSYEFDIVFKNGWRFNREFMAIYVIPLRDFILHLRKKKQYNRMIESKMLLGFSINKKVATACKRNLIRRQIKAIMQEFHVNYKGYAFVFICRKGIVEYDFIALKKHILYSIKRLTQSKNTRDIRHTSKYSPIS